MARANARADRAQARRIAGIVPHGVHSCASVEELSVEETAQCLEIAEATVRSRHFRAKSLLRESLAREIDVAGSELFGFAGARCDRIVANVMSRIGKRDGRIEAIEAVKALRATTTTRQQQSDITSCHGRSNNCGVAPVKLAHYISSQASAVCRFGSEAASGA